MARVKITLEGFKCERCGHEWVKRGKHGNPRVCPKCKSPYWDVPRKESLAAKKAWAKRRTTKKS
jgi:predicted Zn-ribbon and HTH transcriptional regulator